MGRIIATQYMSLDGVIQDPVGMEGSGLGDWTGPFSRGPKGDAFKHRELADADAMIYGRVTYDGFAAVWPLVNDPEGYAARINSLPKYVASRTLETVDWSNSSLIEGDLVDAARKIRASVDGDVLIFGSASIVHQLLPHGLVDELRLMVFPTILGRGTRLFPDGVAATLELAGNEQFGDGIVLLRYTTVQP
ncbi:MAG: dihydrofolate reductase family protein [Mesorhizobium sp.]|nr:dihydrofolate reductase family protein [Mesorhizobium sp.]